MNDFPRRPSVLATERASAFQVVAALQHRDDSSFGMAVGGVGDEPGHPREIVLGQEEVSQRVVGVPVEAGGDENQLRLEVVERR